LSFSYQFTGKSNGVLRIYVDDEAIQDINQALVGLNAADSGQVFLNQVRAPGTHRITFLLEPETDGQVGVILKDLQLGLDLRPVLDAAPRHLSNAFEWSFTGITGQSNYVVEASANLASWLTVTNILGTNTQLRFQTPLPLPDQQRFYRLRIAP
jgi:hypothetical protein